MALDTIRRHSDSARWDWFHRSIRKSFEDRTVSFFTSGEATSFFAMAQKAIASPVPISWYPALAVFMLAIGLVITASFFIYEATSSRRSRSLAKELFTGAVASIFLGFGSLFLLLSCGIYI